MYLIMSNYRIIQQQEPVLMVTLFVLIVIILQLTVEVIEVSAFLPIQQQQQQLQRQPHQQPHQQKQRLLPHQYLSKKDWDAIIAQEDNDDNNSNTIDKLSWKDTITNDMKYNLRNCQRLNQNFVALQNANAPGADIYGCIVKSTTSMNTENAEEVDDDDDDDKEEGTFWFLGKVSHISDISTEQCIQRCYYMILQHAANLRPLDLFGAITNQQFLIWYATPMNSELEVAYNRPTISFQKVLPPSTDDATNKVLKDTIPIQYIGFQGEVYESNEDGFRTIRYIRTGLPARPEIGSPDNDDDDNDNNSDGIEKVVEDDDEYEIPNDEQMEQIQSMLQGKDINAIYEEQEERKKRT